MSGQARHARSRRRTTSFSIAALSEAESASATASSRRRARRAAHTRSPNPATAIIGVPTGVKLFNIIGTLWGAAVFGEIRGMRNYLILGLAYAYWVKSKHPAIYEEIGRTVLAEAHER